MSMSSIPASRSGATVAHPPRPHPVVDGSPWFDNGVQFDVIRDSIMAGEQIYGVYSGDCAGIALCGVTNRRVILLDTAFGGDRAALISAPYGRVTTVAFVSTEREPVFSRTVAIQVARTFYEITCRGEEQAQELHDLVVWRLLF